MTIKALFIANTVMLLFMVLVIIQTLGGMNGTGFIDKMQQQGFVKESAS